MSAATFPTPDVIVVGAGPTGLLLAGDLAAAGARTVLLERRSRESNLTRAFAVHARTLEALDARGLAERLLSTGCFVKEFRLFGRTVIDLGRLPTRFPGVLMTPQYHVEGLLEERAVAAGAELRRGARCAGLRQDADGVAVDVEGEPALRARYVVGADGVRSTVRQAIGMPFPGRAVLDSVMLADVRLDASPGEVPAFRGGPAGFSFVVPFGDGWFRVIAWRRGTALPADAPVDVEELKDVTRALFGTDFGIRDVRWTSRFHSDERQVPAYRDGRVLLAGDAAHVHSPAGGLGMNAGLQDAANLGWKLAAVVRGGAGDELLDSYHAERHPAGEQVLRASGAILRAVLADSPVLRGVRRTAAAALRFAPFAPFVVDRVAMTVSGLGIAYPAPPGSHPLVGRRAPDLPLAEEGPGRPVRLYEALRAGAFVRVVPRGVDAARWAPPPDARAVVTAVRADAARTMLLVRPDGYVGEAEEVPVGWVGGVTPQPCPQRGHPHFTVSSGAAPWAHNAAAPR
ncbi:FAD-dependent monooxygenase [Streptomyces sp. AV19]|uniref:FAD-dependent monooxygenase n=1 Tax=Streptomyces sp. AV19 TaxID=2793068 RepID=UPI0018FEC176|nr:FAD-dependent monooxygenase [Streptomyces sp. AV19]MBH1936003.1 FAD-dependent monooxygenase [Streptomyces sp. AV19]MDG4534205.1 FAD-dependent monooxygenase [Streptomyces sp. AV19]